MAVGSGCGSGSLPPASADASVLSVSNAPAAALMYGPHALAPVVSASAKRKEAPQKTQKSMPVKM